MSIPLITADMDPCKIEPHDLLRDVTTYRETYPTIWETSSSEGRSVAARLQKIVLQAAACANPYTAALATLILNLDVPPGDEPA